MGWETPVFWYIVQRLPRPRRLTIFRRSKVHLKILGALQCSKICYHVRLCWFFVYFLSKRNLSTPKIFCFVFQQIMLCTKAVIQKRHHVTTFGRHYNVTTFICHTWHVSLWHNDIHNNKFTNLLHWSMFSIFKGKPKF